MIQPTPKYAADKVWSAQDKNPADMLDESRTCITRWVGKEPAKMEFAIEKIAPLGSATLLAAGGGVGKSLTGQKSCAAVSTGKPVFGLATMAGAAVGLFAEDADKILHIRQIAIYRSMDITADDIGAGRCHIIPQSDDDVCLWREGKPTAFMKSLEEKLAGIKDLRLLFLDNVAQLYDGDEINRAEVTAFLRHLNRLAARLNIAIILATHTSKSDDGTGLKMASGSTAWVNACRSAIKLQLAQGDNDTVELHLAKSNYARREKICDLYFDENFVLVHQEENSLTDGIKNRRLRQYILAEVEKRQDTEQFLSLSPQTRKGGRYLPAVLCRLPEYKQNDLGKVAQDMLDAGEIECFTSKKKQGLRKGRVSHG